MALCIVIFTGHLTELVNPLFMPVKVSLLLPQLPLWSSNMTQVSEEKFACSYSLQRYTTAHCFRLTVSEGFNLQTKNSVKKGWDAFLIALQTQWWWLCFFSGNADARPPEFKFITVIWVLSSLCSHWLIILWFASNHTPLQYNRKSTQSVP